MSGLSRIITGCMDKMVRVYDVVRPDADPVSIEAHSNTVKTAYFDVTDPNVAFSAGSDNMIKRWDLRSVHVTHSLEVPDLMGMDYSQHCGALVVAAKLMVSFVSPADLSIVKQYACAEDIECAAQSPSDELFAVGSKLKVKEYDKATGTELQVHRGHHGPVFTVQYAPNSTAFASGSEDGMVRIWPTSKILKQAKEIST
jgi:serine-threonine kinase receptor-associated protein